MGELDQLLTCWENLGNRERKVVLVFMHRLWAGQKIHGKLEADKKDWTYEALEEIVDLSVYMCAALQDKSDKALASIVERAELEVSKPQDWITPQMLADIEQH